MEELQGILGDIQSVRKGSRFMFPNKREIYERLSGDVMLLINVRQYLSAGSVFKIVGFPDIYYQETPKRKTKLSYLQLYNTVVRYANKGTFLKKPWKIESKVELKLK